MSEIRAGTTSTTALVQTADTTGNITLTPDSGVVTLSSTGALTVPKGTTAQRPSSPVAGMTRFNTSRSNLEIYNGTIWQAFTVTAAEADVETRLICT